MRGVVALFALFSVSVLAQYPAKPVKLVVPFAPGGGTDILGRILAERLADALGKSFVVENRPGGAATLGAELVARSDPDGYTLLFGTSAELTIAPSLRSNIRYNPVSDFLPVSMIGSTPAILLASNTFPAKNLKEIIAMARQNPGRVTFASGGSGTAPHLAGELLREMAGIDMQHVPYKGSGPAQSDLIGGHVNLMFSTVAPSIAIVHTNKAQAIAVTSAKRSSALPAVPTIAELGYPGYDVSIWYGLFAPSKTPSEIVFALRGAIEKLIQEKPFLDRLQTLGIDASPPEERGNAAAVRIGHEIEKWARIIRNANIQTQ